MRLLVVILAFSVFLTGCSSSEREPDLFLNSTSLYEITNQITKNKIVAKEKYDGKWIEVTGRASYNGEDDIIKGVTRLSLEYQDINKQKWTINFYTKKKNKLSDFGYEEGPRYPGDIVTLRGKINTDTIKFSERRISFWEDDSFWENEWVYLKPKHAPTIPRDKPIVLTGDKVMFEILGAQKDNRFKALADYREMPSIANGKIKEIKENTITLVVAEVIEIECSGIPREKIKTLTNGQKITVQGKIGFEKGLIVKIDPLYKRALMNLTNCTIDYSNLSVN